MAETATPCSNDPEASSVGGVDFTLFLVHSFGLDAELMTLEQCGFDIDIILPVNVGTRSICHLLHTKEIDIK